MKVQLIISPAEAVLCAAALDFVRRSLTLSATGASWIFRDGGKFDCDTKGLMSLGYVSASLNEAVAEESDRVRFAGYCNVN